MKSIFIIILFLTPISLFSQLCGFQPTNEPDDPGNQTDQSRSFDDCTNPWYCNLLELNPEFLPDENDPTLEVRINLHVIVHATDPSTYPNYVEGNVDHEHFLRINLARMNSEIYGGFWEGMAIEEKCDDVFTGIFAIDSKIRFVVNGDINWHYGDATDITNADDLCGSHAYSKFVEPFPDLFDNALNVIFIENDSGHGGCGQALLGETSNYVTINNSFTARYIPNANYKEKANLAHEFGHALGLGHPDDEICIRDNMGYGCQIHDDGGNYTGKFNHVMHGNGSIQRYFAPLETAQMRRYLTTTWRKKWLTTIPPAEERTITINGTETWDNNIVWDGDIIVPTNSELVLFENELSMSKDKKIFVERGARLIINRAKITTCGTEQWGGIKVEGFPLKAFGNGQPDDPFGSLNANNSGIVAIIRGGQIDNAYNGISTNNDHLSWSDKKTRFGGLIHADVAQFSRCNRAVEIMKYGTPQVPDKSSFNITYFISCKDGVTNWASDGVTFTGCQFIDIEHAATGGYNAAINLLSGNNFSDVGIGVDLVGTRRNVLSSIIGVEGAAPNKFDDTYICIFSSTVNNFRETKITNNEFEADVGIQVEGPTSMDCINNDFSGKLGYFAFDSDKFINNVSHNKFTGNTGPITAMYDNSFLTFTNNCMDFTWGQDVWMFGTQDDPGKVNIKQGNNFFAAGNCFTNGIIPDIASTGVIDNFTYFVGNGVPTTSCLFPETQGNYDIDFSLGTLVQDCGTGFFNEPPSEGCIPAEDPIQIKSDISILDTEILYLKENNGSKFSLNTSERCLVNYLNKLASIYYLQKNFTELNNYFAQRQEFQYKTIPFDAYVAEEDYFNARAYLNALSTQSVEQTNYKTSQGIFLDFLELEYFELSAIAEYHLQNVGIQPGPLNAFSRSIYYIITGDRIAVPMPPRIEERRNEPVADEATSGISVFPNPVFDGNIKIEGIEAYQDLGPIYANIIDASGRSVYFDVINKNELNLGDNLTNGLYFLQIINKEVVIHREKVLIAK